MASNPTIIVGHLNDKELKDSIDSLVKHVDKGTQDMVNAFNARIDEMKRKLAELGQEKVNFNLESNDSGSGKRSKATKEETASIKELTMSYDRMLGALQMAQRQERMYASKNIWTLTREELEKYESAVRRVADLQKSMREMQGKMALAQVQQSQFTPNLKEFTDDLVRTNDGLKKMNEWYKQLEKESSNKAQYEKLRQEATERENTIAALRQSIALLKQERELMAQGSDDLRRQNNLIAEQEEQLKRELRTREDIHKAIVDRNIQKFRDANTLPVSNLDEAIAKLNRLKDVQKDIDGIKYLFKEEQLNRVQNAINQITEKIEKMKQKLPIETEFIPNITKQAEETQRLAELEQKYGQEVAQAAQYIREQAANVDRLQLAQNGTLDKFTLYNPVYNPSKQSLEEQLALYKQTNTEANIRLEIEKAIAIEERKAAQALEESRAAVQQAMQERKTAQEKQNPNLNFDDYENLRAAIAAVIGVRQQDVRIADTENDSLKALSNTVNQLRQAYELLSKSDRETDHGRLLVDNIQHVQRAMRQIQSEMSRPTSFDLVKALPEKTIDDISYKIQMLRSYAQGINVEVEGGDRRLKRVNDTVDGLQDKLKKLQQLSKKNDNSTRLNEIAKMPESTFKEMSDKILKLMSLIDRLKRQPIVDENNLKRAETMFERLRKSAFELSKVQGTKKNVNDILGLKDSVKTLGEVSQLMQRIQTTRSNLNFNTQRDEINQLTKAYNDLQKKQQEILGTNKNVIESNNALSRSFNYMKNRLAFYFTVGASTQFVKTLYDIRSQYELLERSIGILVDSAQQGTQIFSELNAMAIKSPFTTMELGAAAKQLVAYDIAAKDVVETTKRIGDIAAAAGIPMERLTYSLGHIKAFGYLNARDARMWANAGIPIVKNLADRYTELEGRLVSVSDVYDRIKKKTVGFEDVLDVIHSMTDEGGKFFNFQEKAADTMKVRLANLTLAYNNMMNELGKTYQSTLTKPLIFLKTLYENWRKISNGIYGVVGALSVLKIAQLANIMLTQKVGIATAASDMMTSKWVGRLYALRGALASVAFNPFTWVAAVAGVLTYLINEYIDLNRENDRFNQSLRDNSEENIKSINKFFEDYNSHLKNIGNDSLVNQQKMWERIQEEIEKTSKNAKNYVYELEKIPSITERIKKGIEVLSQSQYIQKQIKDMASHGLFSIGGGFANESLAQDLKEYEENMNRLIRKFGDLQKAREHFGGREKTLGDINYKNQWGEYMSSLRAVQSELNDFEKTLDRVRTKDIIGDGTNFQKLENLREFAYTIRDNFLATEQGSKIGAEGQALLNSMMDEWVSKQAFANKLISQQQSIVEKNRGAWEIFFSHLKEDERKSLDFLIETGKTSTKAFEDIWTNAANRMKESSFAAYSQIQDDIAKLRATPDIVINVVYRQNKEKLDADQKQFVADFLTPSNKSSQKFYFEQQDELRSMYGRFQRKADEDYVEWEKRLGEEYRNNAESIKKLNKQLDENENKSSEYYKAQKKQRDDLVETQTHLENIRDALGFDFEKDSDKKAAAAHKKAVDEVSDALQKEIRLINEMRSNYDKLRKSGVSNMEAIELASQGYEDTILRINNILGKYGINKFNASNFTGKDVKTLLNNLESQRKTLLASGKVKLASLQSLDVEIKKLSVDAKTYDMKKVTDGLNNELGKLKEEYELAVELEANPELGNMFTDMMDIDVSGLPRTFEQVFSRANKIAQDKLNELGVDIKDFDILSTIIKGDEKNRWMGFDMESEPIKELLKYQKTFRDMFKKMLVDTEKDLDDYVKKYGGYADKVAEIESNRLQRISRLNNAYYTEEMRKRPEYIAKLNAIEQGARREMSNAEFDEFKNSRYYTMMFENLEFVSTRSINTMREKLEGLMNTMSDLRPEQLKTVMQQYEKLEQTLIKRNPFRTLSKDLRNYIKVSTKIRGANKEFESAQKEYDAQQKVVAALKIKKEQAKRNKDVNKEELESIDKEINAEQIVLDLLLQQLDAAEKKADKYNMIKKLAMEEVAQVVSMVNANLQSLGQLRDFLQDDLGMELGNEFNGFVDGMTKASEGMNNIISSAQSGNVVGTVLGVGQAITGLADGVSSLFGGGAARTRRLNREIAKSEEAVRQLNQAYKELERTVDSAMGAEELRARRSEIANKRAQLAELERQMELERQKRSKDRDDEKIKQYEESIQDLRYEIEDLVDDIAGTLLGSGVKDAAESFVDTWVSAWREGSDTMDALKQKFDDMIDTMIAKSLASRLVSKRIQHIWDAVDAATNEESEGGAEITLAELQRLRALVGDKSIAERINEDLTNLYNALGIAYGSNGDGSKNLSNLQQGIQGITEDTAGAIEAYMNSVSQQVYYQSDILTQIRDTMLTFDLDIQTGTMSQMLLQLQQSYSVQVAIQNTLNGVLNPSGRAFVVEMV